MHIELPLPEEIFKEHFEVMKKLTLNFEDRENIFFYHLMSLA